MQSYGAGSPPPFGTAAAPVRTTGGSPREGDPGLLCGFARLLERHRRGTFAVRAAPADLRVEEQADLLLAI